MLNFNKWAAQILILIRLRMRGHILNEVNALVLHILAILTSCYEFLKFWMTISETYFAKLIESIPRSLQLRTVMEDVRANI